MMMLKTFVDNPSQILSNLGVYVILMVGWLEIHKIAEVAEDRFICKVYSGHDCAMNNLMTKELFFHW